MDQLPIEELAKWADGKSLGVILTAINAFAATGPLRDFLEARRTRSGRFAVDPAGDDAEWFGFYRSHTRFVRSVAKATLGEEADQIIPIMDALRKPKAAAHETRMLAFSAIVACFMKPSGSDLAKILEIAFGADSDKPSEEEIPEDISLLFCFWVFFPCWFVYGTTPIQLMRQVRRGGEFAEEAVERIVRLDHRAASHPVIRRWVLSDPKLAFFKQGKLDKWRSKSPFDKEKSESLALRHIAGLTAKLSDLLDEPLEVTDQRELIESLDKAIPDDLQSYVVGQTNDDFSRGIRRQKAHFQLPPKPDKSAFESVRALLEKLQ